MNAMSNLSELIEAARGIKDQFDTELLRANVNIKESDSVAASLCLTISEQFEATLALMVSGFSLHAPLLIRSMLEGLADLLNLVNDPAYLDQMRFDNARADAQLFTDYAGDPEMLEDREAQESLVKWKAMAEPIRDELKQRGFRQLKIQDRFKRANIQSTYVAYRVLSGFAHNQLTTLRVRHSGKLELRYNAEVPEELTMGMLNIALSILYQSVQTTPHYTDLNECDLRQILDDVDEVWKVTIQAKT